MENEMTDLFPELPKTRVFVKPNDEGWPIATTGNSAIDGKDYCISTHHMKADEVPEILMDAKTTAEYICKLINSDMNKPDGVWSEP